MTAEEGAASFGGRFVLGDLLGVGGSAAAYEAEDIASADASGHARQVALKVLHPHLSADTRLREAFLAEAHATQQVRHPNVAAVLGAGVHEAGGVPLAWLALELVPGGSLADRVATGGPLGPVEAAAVLDGVLAALGAAHAAGLVHRDVTPANVLLARGPGSGPVEATDVRLVDFGLADATGRPAIGSDVLGATSGDAAAASVVGSAHYMSPEQAHGNPVRAAGDLYQAGALLYFALTGQPPYPRSTTAQVLAAHVSAPPPVPSALVAAARPLDRVVTHAMAKSAVRRYRDAAEFRAALAQALAGLREATLVAADEPGADRAVATLSDFGLDLEADGGTTRVLPPGAPRRPDYLEPDVAARPAPRAEPWRDAAPAGRALAAVGVAVVLVGAVVWGAVAAGRDPGSPPPTVSASPTSTPTIAPQPTSSRPADPLPAPSPDLVPPVEPAPVAVPTLFGTLSDAVVALRDAGLELGVVTRTDSPEVADRVLGQWPEGGQEVTADSVVDVTVATGSNLVPTVAGRTVAVATAELVSAGFTVTADPAVPSSAVVAGTHPAAGTALRVGSPVSLVLASPTPSPAPTVTPSVPPDGGET